MGTEFIKIEAEIGAKGGLGVVWGSLARAWGVAGWFWTHLAMILNDFGAILKAVGAILFACFLSVFVEPVSGMIFGRFGKVF